MFVQGVLASAHDVSAAAVTAAATTAASLHEARLAGVEANRRHAERVRRSREAALNDAAAALVATLAEVSGDTDVIAAARQVPRFIWRQKKPGAACRC